MDTQPSLGEVFLIAVLTPPGDVAGRRRPHAYLPARSLLAGDVIEVDGFTLAVVEIRKDGDLMALLFDGLDYEAHLHEDRLVRTISRVDRFTPTHGRALWL